MSKESSHSAPSLDFSQIGTQVAESLQAIGHQIMPMESQKWAVQYSVSGANMDGSAEILFGPETRSADGGIIVPFDIVGRQTRKGDVLLAKDANEAAVAAALVSRFHEILVELWQSPHQVSPGVGAGLLPVNGRAGLRE